MRACLLPRHPITLPITIKPESLIHLGQRVQHTLRQVATRAMSSDASAETVLVCVHAATEAERGAAKDALANAALGIPQQQKQQPTGTSTPAPIPPIPITLDFHNPAASLAPHCGTFDTEKYFNSLESTVLGRVLCTAAAVPSTQAIVQNNVAVLPDGTLVVTDKQMQGKGRGGNSWESPPGCLMFSCCKRISVPGERLPFVQYLVSLAVLQAVQDQAAQRLGAKQTVDLRIKWPNDLYSGNLKVGGVLCHSSYRNNLFHVIMGVGLNLSNRTPTTCIDAMIQTQATKLGLSDTHTGLEPVSREALLAGIMTRLDSMLEILSTHGFSPFESDYYAAWLHSGQVLEVEDGDGEVKERVNVTVKGLSRSGYLLAEGREGGRYELHPDGNSLDFFKGLVRKKVM